MATVYIAQDGSDSASGKESAPWATFTKALAKITDGTLGQGDTILLKDGGTFYEKLYMPSGFTSVTSGEFLTIGRYGNGKRLPILSSYKTLNISGGWSLHATGIWKLDLTNLSSFGGYQGVTPTVGDQVGDGTDIGHLLVDGVLYGGRHFGSDGTDTAGALTSLAATGAQWDFVSDNAQYLYVKSSANPTTLAADIRAATDGACVLGRGALAMHGIRLEGAASHGITGNLKYSRFMGLEIANIGGGRLDGQGDGTLRYGNGINLTPGSQDVVLDFIKILNCYDVALSPQGGLSSGRIGWSNIRARRLFTWGCSQNFEHWSTGTPETGSGLQNFSVRHCFFGDTNGPWISNGWRDGGVAGARHILIKPTMTLGAADSEIVDNVFYGGVVGGSYHDIYVDPTGLEIDRNTVILPDGMVLSSNAGESTGGTITTQTVSTEAEVAQWKSRVNTDQDSQFMLLPDDPSASPLDALQAHVARVGLSETRVRSLEEGVVRLAGDLYGETKALKERTRRPNVYRTLASSGGNQHTRLCRLRMNGANDKSAVTLLVSESDTSGLTNMGVAIVHFKIYAGSSNNIRANVAIKELIPFDRASSGKFKASNFTPVLKTSDNAYAHEVELWFSLTNNYQGLQFTPLTERWNAGGAPTYYTEDALSGSVPADYSTGSPTIVKTVIPRTDQITSLDVTYAASFTPVATDAIRIYNIGQLTGGITIGAPTGTAYDGQLLKFRFEQDGTGRTITWNAAFVFGTDFPSANVPSSANAKFEVEFQYHATAGKWRCIGITRGFA